MATIECMIEDPRWAELNLQDMARRAVQATLEALGLVDGPFIVSVLGCDDDRIATLNADFRGRPQPTNVLSWPSAERAAGVPGEMPLAPDPTDPEIGDIAISYGTCYAEAAQMGKTMSDHATHLLVHGTLHLLGYDHERDADATLMEGLEREILGNLNIADPY